MWITCVWGLQGVVFPVQITVNEQCLAQSLDLCVPLCGWWIANAHFSSITIHKSIISLLQIHFLSGIGWFTSNFDLCAISICTLHIRVVAVGNCTVPYHRMRQRHFDWRVRIHIDCTISRTLLCHRESTQKTAGKRHAKHDTGFYGAYSLCTPEPNTHTYTPTSFI